MVVQHNISAMTANRYYGINNSSLGKSMEKLSSGYAINRAGDNAAGLAVSEKMRAQIAGLTQASKNAQDGISMVQTYEGALQETDSILQRMRTIAVQSANGSYQNDVDRDALQLEFDQLNDELNQIADTDFNGVVVLNGGVMSDGTVANDTTKIADRPDIASIETSPNAAFTYKSTVNGTVDSGGNGSLSINGVTLKLKNGEGTAELGNTSLGKTSYDARGITVTNGKVNGTVDATETYKIDSETNKVEIHGNSYTISGEKLLDDNGGTQTVIDGLLVTVDAGKSITLTGSYEIKDSVVKTGASFSDTDKGIGGVVDQNGNGRLSFNNNVITLSGGTFDQVSDKTDADIKYDVGTTNWSLNNDGTVSGSIATSGSKTLESFTGSKTIEFTKMDTNGTADISALNVYSASIGSQTVYYDAGTKSFYDSIVSNQNSVAGMFTSTAITSLAMNGTGNTAAKATTDATTAIEYTFPAAADLPAAADFNGKVVASTEQKGYTVAGNTYKTNFDQTAWLTAAGSVDSDGNAKAVAGKDGVKIDSTGVISGTTALNSISATAQKNVGSFKVSQGVSTSDTYNHGAGNLTFADNMTLQVGARSKDAVTFNFSYTTNGIGNLKADLNASARGLGTDQVSVKNQEDANAAIDAIDNAINKVSMIRGTFGAIQNRLEHKISNIDTNAENITAAESRIRDTQMDQEMMKFTSAQILSQASQSMLAQANSLPQGVLQLLG